MTPYYDVDRMELDMVLRGWSRLELARQSGLSSPTVYRYFSGDCQSAKTTAKIAAALGYPVRRYIKIPRRLRGVA